MIWLILSLWFISNIIIAWAIWAKPLPPSDRAADFIVRYLRRRA